MLSIERVNKFLLTVKNIFNVYSKKLNFNYIDFQEDYGTFNMWEEEKDRLSLIISVSDDLDDCFWSITTKEDFDFFVCSGHIKEINMEFFCVTTLQTLLKTLTEIS